MPTQGRKNVHGKAGVRFKAPYDKGKKENQLRNLVSTLIVDGRVTCSHQMVQPLIALADRLITYAKKGDLHHRRLAASYVRSYVVNAEAGTVALDKLFTELGPRFSTRNGGYTRRLKLVPRLGDNSQRILIEFVE
jgi:large subunit ribosomal protein L17